MPGDKRTGTPPGQDGQAGADDDDGDDDDDDDDDDGGDDDDNIGLGIPLDYLYHYGLYQLTIHGNIFYLYFVSQNVKIKISSCLVGEIAK